MPTLTDYQTETLELLHDPSNTYFSQTDVNNYINRARNRIAGRSQSVRFLAQGGTIVSLAIVTGGTFTNNGVPTITVTGAGQQANVTGTVAGNTLTGITLNNGGWGYITGTTTTLTFVDHSGVPPTVVPNITITIDNSLTTVPGQEVYQFSLVNTLIAAQSVFTGINQALGIISLAGAWGANAAMKPMLMQMIWSEFQAYYRSYNTGLQSYPTVWSQYGQGQGTLGGSIYLWPLPSQFSEMDWDVWCTPITMTQGGSQAEALPYPWSSAVPYYAAYLGYLNAQRPEDAKMMKEEYDARVKEAVTMTHDAFVGNYYEGDTSY